MKRAAVTVESRADGGVRLYDAEMDTAMVLAAPVALALAQRVLLQQGDAGMAELMHLRRSHGAFMFAVGFGVASAFGIILHVVLR